MDTSSTGKMSDDGLSDKSFDDRVDAIGVLRGLRVTIERFLADIENLIEVYVRPTIALALLTKHEHLNLYQNIEKVRKAALRLNGHFRW